MDSLVLVALSTIEFEKVPVETLNEICMFCFFKAENLKLVNSIPRTELFWKLSNIRSTNDDDDDDVYPQKICHVCLETFKSIAKFVDQINGNVAKFKEIYRKKMTQLVKLEEFDCDEPKIVKIEQIDEEFAENDKVFLYKEIQNTQQLQETDVDDDDDDDEDERLSHKAPSEEKFRCIKCQKLFKTKAWLKRHTLNVHLKMRTRRQCEICNKGFVSQSDLNNHLKSHTPGNQPYVCSDCGKIFRKYSTFVVHNQYHKLKNGEIKQEEDTKSYLKLQCENCKEIFTSRNSLKMHIAISQQQIISSTDKELIPCKKCDQVFPTRFKLSTHISNVHLNFKCANCVKTFRLKASLMKHMTKYHKLTLSSCDLCKRTFTCQEDLKKHEKIHVRTKKYNCNIISNNKE